MRGHGSQGRRLGTRKDSITAPIAASTTYGPAGALSTRSVRTLSSTRSGSRYVRRRERRALARTRPIVHSGRVNAQPLVRSPEVRDAEQIARAKNDSWRVGYRGRLPDAVLDGLDDARSTAQWVEWLRDGYENAGVPGEVRVTTDAARQVVGVSVFGADRDAPDDASRGELWVLYVAPSHWGHGYGCGLLRDAEETLVAAGRGDLALWVLQGNDRARRFYERAGWRDDDGMKPFGDSGLTEVRYRKQV